MAKIALVNPPYLFWEAKFDALRKKSDSTPPLGLYILAAGARRAGHEVEVFDSATRPEPLPRMVSRIRAFAPDLLGISAVTVNVHHAAAIAREVRASSPGTVTVLGGPHGTALPEVTLDRFPHFDAIVLGEGEHALLEIAERGRDGLDAVQGLALPGGGGVSRTGARPPIKDLDSVDFPAWDMLPGFPRGYSAPIFNFKRLPAAALITSRGCPLKCRFCDRSVFGDRIRFHSASYVLEMIDRLVSKYGVRHLIFFDDMFVANRKRLFEICEGLSKYGGKVSFSCNGRVGFMDREMLAVMKKAGCWQMAFGIESGDQRVLDFIGKKQTLAEIERDVRITKEARIRVKGLFMMGLPGDSRATILSTLEFAKKLDLDLFQITKFTPLPGSELYPEASELGSFDDDWTRMNMLNSVFVPRGMTSGELDDLFWNVNRGFYARGSMALKLTRFFIENPSQLKVGLKTGIEFFGNTLRRRSVGVSTSR